MRWHILTAAASISLLQACGQLVLSAGGPSAAPPPATSTATGTSTAATPSAAAPSTVAGNATAAVPSTTAGTSSTPSGAAPAPSGPVTPVLVFLSGYTSCGTNNANELDPTLSPILTLFQTAQQELQAKGYKSVPWLLGCYGTDNVNIVYTRSTDNGKISTDTVQDMITALGQLTSGVAHPSLFVTGHSYGGWTAMDVVLQVGGTDHVAGLMTLDPISKVTCTPANFVDALLGVATDPGCTEAPTDFGASGLAQIAEQAGKWENFYQTDLAALHSGPIANASSNTQRSYPGAQGFDAHNDLLSDQGIQAALKAAVQAAF